MIINLRQVDNNCSQMVPHDQFEFSITVNLLLTNIVFLSEECFRCQTRFVVMYIDIFSISSILMLCLKMTYHMAIDAKEKIYAWYIGIHVP